MRGKIYWGFKEYTGRTSSWISFCVPRADFKQRVRPTSPTTCNMAMEKDEVFTKNKVVVNASRPSRLSTRLIQFYPNGDGSIFQHVIADTSKSNQCP